jgi:hypothetical protein
VSIEQVIVCYELSDSTCFISQVRLLEMAGPGQAIVLHDDPTPLNKPSDSYVSTVGGKTPTSGRAVTLGLRLVFQATTDEVRLGAVGVGIDLREQPAAWLARAETLAAFWREIPPSRRILGASQRPTGCVRSWFAWVYAVESGQAAFGERVTSNPSASILAWSRFASTAGS